MTKSLFAALAIVFAVGLPSATPAQEKAQDKPAAAQEQKKDPKTEAYEKAVKDLKRVEGPWVLYQSKKEIFLELPEDKLGKVFLVQATLATGLDSGLMHAGMPIGSNAVDAFRFDRKEDSLWLVRPSISNRWNKDDVFAPGAERQFQEAILGSFKITQENPDKKLVLVNVTRLFYGDVFRLNELIAQGLSGPYMLDSEKSGPESVKGFPENTVVQMRLHYISPRGGEENPFAAMFGLSAPTTLEDSRSAPVKVTYSVWFRRDNGYVPRVADPRIGYFTESFFSVDKYLNTDRTEHYINRFNLVKKDPSASLSEPVKPIVFTIDNTIPPAYRDSVKEGVLRWNKAFEGVGFKNAIQVQDQPKDPDYDHADGRYNVIRMMVSPSSIFGAISLFRTDPFTGEILNTSITLDGNLIRDLQEEHLRNQAATFGGKRALSVMLRDDNRAETDDHFLFATQEQRAKEDLLSRMTKFGWGNDMCTYASDLTSDAVVAWTSIQGAPHGVNKEEYVKRFLADTVSHEVGHTLGLRHNFAGSINLSTAELADDKLTSQVGTTASVMDYTPPNVQAVLKGSGNFYSPVIGPYDMWAIQYGYTGFGSNDPVGEKFHLGQIASQSGKRGLAYMTDEDVDRWNPYAVKFDGASDPLNFSQKTILSMKRAQQYAIANMPRKGESYARRTMILMNTFQRMFREGRTAGRFVGGIVGNRNFKGDANEKPTLAPVDAVLQRQAARMIVTDFFAPNAFKLPEDVMKSMSVDPDSGGWTAPLRDYLGGAQQNLVAMMLSYNTTGKIAENAFKTKNAYGLDEHFNLITSNVFAEIGRNEAIDPLRRDLQRFTLSGFTLIGGAESGMVNEDARMLANDAVKRVNLQVKEQLKHPEKLDNMTKLHLRDMSDTIARYLSRR